MYSYMKPTDWSMRLAGSALTVRVEPGDIVDPLDALLAIIIFGILYAMLRQAYQP